MSGKALAGHARGGSYSEEETERGLLAVALAAGNTRRAARQLKAQGYPIPRGTLSKWITSTHPERYEHVRRAVLPRIREALAIEAEDLAREYAEAERLTLEKFRAELPNLRPHEAASALRNLATSRGISTDKANVLRERPAQITERRDVGELLAALARMGVRVSGAPMPPVELVTALPPASSELEPEGAATSRRAGDGG